MEIMGETKHVSVMEINPKIPYLPFCNQFILLACASLIGNQYFIKSCTFVTAYEIVMCNRYLPENNQQR